MPSSPGHYTLACWNSTQNPSTVVRSKLMFQCHKLIQALRARLMGGQLVVPSRDAKESRKGIEICVMYQAGTALSFANIKDVLNEESTKLSLDYREFVEQEESLTRYFSDTELANLGDLDKPITEALSEADFELLEKTVHDARGLDALDSWTQGIPREKVSQPIMLMRRTLARLRKAEGDDLERELTGLLDGLNAASKAPKTSWQTIVAIASGIMTIGGAIAKLTGIWATIVVAIETVAAIAALLTTTGIAAAIAAALLAFGLIGAGLYLVFKGARNLLLVVNNTGSDVQPVCHDVYSGQVTTGTDVLPRTTEQQPFCWAGWYIYDRKTGFYGTTAGLVFRCGGGAHVAIGLDCPNSALGGRNSVTLTSGSDPADVQSRARSCHTKGFDLTYPTGSASARIASNWGNINWARLILDGQ